VTGRLSTAVALVGGVALAVAIARAAGVSTAPTERVPVPAPTAPARALDGPAADLARDHVPDLPFPSPQPEDVARSGGVPMSVRDLVVVFAPMTTVAEANAVLRSLPAVVVGGNPDAQTILVRLTGPSDLARVLAAQARLLGDPLIAAASVVMGAQPERAAPGE
jgi:hypothetical protein